MRHLLENDASIIILTKNPKESFNDILRAVYSQKYPGKFEVIVIDSGSTDEILNIAKRYQNKIVNIKPEDFGHGKTRNLGARLAAGEYLVFLTQDAMPATDEWLFNLLKNFGNPDIAAVYGKQIPYDDINPVEKIFLGSRYPDTPIIQQSKNGETDIDNIFFSDVNSAIRKNIWEKILYQDDIIGAEDIEWAKRAIHNNHRIVYVPEAAVYHSHDYNLKTVFQRYFDVGVSFSQYQTTEYSSNKVFSQGLKYTIHELKFLLSNGYVKWLPYAVLYDLAKFSGVMLGKKERWLPLRLKEYLSMNSYFWRRR